MKAVVYDRYGPPEVLTLQDVPDPVPADDQVLVRVHATTVTQTDCHMRRARPLIWRFMLGLRRPKRRTLGSELAGVVEAVGARVSELSVGDRVFGVGSGTHAELVCVRETGAITRMPDGWTFEDAAAVCDGASQALGHLTDARVGEGTRLLVYGASGSCGTAAVQLAKHHLGAHVTAVCAPNALELVRSLGADEVLDYTREDFTRSGKTYDVILDAVGKHSFFRCRRALVPGGIFAATDGLYNFPLALVTRLGGKKVRLDVTHPSKEGVLFLKGLMESGAYRAVVDRTYPLEDAVEAHRYVDSWQKVGNVVLTVGGTA